MMGIVVVGAIGCAGTRHLDPPPPPPALVPAVAIPSTPPSPGVARVVFDVVDGPSLIQIKNQSMAGVMWSPLCTTPCAADIPAGQHDLSFQLKSDPTHGDNDLLTVTAGETVYRRALGEHATHQGLLIGGYVLGYGGLSVFMFSGMMAAFPLESNPSDHSARNTMLVSAGAMAVGALLFYAGWPSDQPGSVAQFALPPR